MRTIARLRVQLADTAQKLGNTTASGQGMADVDATDYARATRQIATPTAMQPSTIQAGSQNAMGSPTQNTTGSQNTNGMYALRQGLTDRGVDSGRIGWNNGWVTLDGTNVFQPSVNIDGTTYADEQTINMLAQKAYQNKGDELVAARTYANSSLDPSLVTWDSANGTVNIAGMQIKPTYVTSNGVAYVPKSEMDNVLAAYRQRTGYISPSQAYEQNNSKYDRLRDDALTALKERAAWNAYDPETDPVYQAYKAMYTRNAEDAYRRALNNNNTSVTGASGAVLSEALAARNAQMQRLNDVIPSLAQDSYNRYLGENQRLRDLLSDTYRAADNDYERRRQLSDTEYNRYRDSVADNRYYDQTVRQNRLDDQNAYTQSLQDEAARMQNEYMPGMLNEQLRSMRIGNDTSDVALRQATFDLEKGISYDTFGRVNVKNNPTYAQIFQNLGCTVDENGTVYGQNGLPLDLRNPQYETTVAVAQAQSAGGERGKLNAILGLPWHYGM